jgi:uncharacterized protein YqeY
MTAHAAAGTFDFASGLKLVQKRGQLMDEACVATSGAMAAMIGADENAVRALAADADVDVANINAPGQIVISGERAKVEAAIGMAKEHGIRRATLLNVAGAYHSRLMETAYRKLGDALADMPMKTPRFAVISNVTGGRVKAPDEIRRTRCKIKSRAQCAGSIAWSDLPGRARLRFFHRVRTGRGAGGLLRRLRKDDGCYVQSATRNRCENAPNGSWRDSRLTSGQPGVECKLLPFIGSKCRASTIGFGRRSLRGMTLQERLDSDLKEAMRAKDTTKLGVLRMLKSALKYAAIAKSDAEAELSEAEAAQVMRKQAKQRKDSIERFEKGGRAELAKKEREELSILNTYLPQAMTTDELAEIVRETIAEVGATSKAQMGAVMKALQAKVAGRVDGKTLSQEVQKRLSP